MEKRKAKENKNKETKSEWWLPYLVRGLKWIKFIKISEHLRAY